MNLKINLLSLFLKTILPIVLKLNSTPKTVAINVANT